MPLSVDDSHDTVTANRETNAKRTVHRRCEMVTRSRTGSHEHMHCPAAQQPCRRCSRRTDPAAGATACIGSSWRCWRRCSLASGRTASSRSYQCRRRCRVHRHCGQASRHWSIASGSALAVDRTGALRQLIRNVKQGPSTPCQTHPHHAHPHLQPPLAARSSQHSTCAHALSHLYRHFATTSHRYHHHDFARPLACSTMCPITSSHARHAAHAPTPGVLPAAGRAGCCQCRSRRCPARCCRRHRRCRRRR